MSACLTCFRGPKSDNSERDPLLPKHHDNDPGEVPARPTSSSSVVDKVLDVLAALKAGKLPELAQISRALQALLHSELLREDTTTAGGGNGPTSEVGRRVLGDVRDLAQSLLRFGLEKNSDDILQQLYFQLKEVKSETSVETAAQAVSATLVDVGQVEDLGAQIAFDSATVLHAVRTLCEVSLKSAEFRLTLADLLSIGKEFVSVAAINVEQAAGEVQNAADSTGDIIAAVGGGTVDDMVRAGSEAAQRLTDVAQNVPHELKDELTGLGDDSYVKAKAQVQQRVQQVLARLHRDPASRGAMRALFILIRKYAGQLGAAMERPVDTTDDAANYPPQPYPQHTSTAADALFANLKVILQRIAQGYSLDNLFDAFGRVVKGLEEAPLVLHDEVDRLLEEEASSHAQAVSPTLLVAQDPGVPGKKRKKNKKARMREKKAAEKALKMSPSVSESQMTASSGNDTPSRPSAKNPLPEYFTRLGAYADRAVDEPGWATSGEAVRTLDGLLDDGFELLGVVGSGIANIAVGNDGAARTPANQTFKTDLVSLVHELEAFVTAVQNDRATMGVLHGLSAVGDDLAALFAAGHGLRPWASWIGWAIPRVLRMLPADALPVPSVELKTGNIEVAVRALFIKGVAAGTGVDTSLVPGTIVLQEWTEVRIDPAEPTPGAALQTTSRVRMYVDGVRARVENMGYYFKYAGTILGYEDEGLMSVNVGSGGPHDGLRADVELELESDSDVPEPAEPAPLFRIVGVNVALRGLTFRITQSRHWILNTLLVQHLAGPTVARVARQALEARISAALGVLAQGLGTVAHDARRNAAQRKESQQGESGPSADGVAERLGDWWRALLDNGPALFGRTAAAEADSAAEEADGVAHHTTNTVTKQGVIHTDTKTVTEQPRGTPAMVYNTQTGGMEEINLSITDIGGEVEVREEGTTVIAVGDGAQLFPGKGGPYGATDQGTTSGIVDHAANGLHNVADGVVGAEAHWRQKVKQEERNAKSWKSKAFDF